MASMRPARAKGQEWRTTIVGNIARLTPGQALATLRRFYARDPHNGYTIEHPEARAELRQITGGFVSHEIYLAVIRLLGKRIYSGE